MKREEKTERTKQKIIQAAIEEFGQSGYQGASLSNICKTGIPKGLLYHNYPSRDDVYLACVKNCYEHLMMDLHQIEGKYDFSAYMEIRLNFLKQHPMEANLIFDSILQNPVTIKIELENIRQEFDTFNKEYFLRFLSHVSLRKGVETQDALQYFTIMQTMFNLYFESEEFKELSTTEKSKRHETSLPKFMEFLLYGIADKKGVEQ